MRKSKNCDKIGSALLALRNIIRYTSLMVCTEDQIDSFASKNMKKYGNYTNLCEGFFQFVIEHHELMWHNENPDGVYKWWSSFIFFLNLFFEARSFYITIFDIMFIKDEEFENCEPGLRVKEFISKNNFMLTWTRLLYSSTASLAPFNDLLEIYCDGELERKCKVCSDNIRISTFHPSFLIGEIQLLKYYAKDVFLEYEELRCGHSGQNHIDTYLRQSFLCGRISCRKKNELAETSFRDSLTNMSSLFRSRYKKNRCDGCYNLSIKVHRCSTCKTKIYCSEKCQAVDWKVHKYCCEGLSKSEFHQATKVKNNSGKRNLTGRRNMAKKAKAIRGLEKEIRKKFIEVD